MDDKKNDVIDLRVIISLLLQRKKLFVKVLIVTFVIASALILCVPRTYTCTVKLAPEAASATTGSALGSIASSLGFDLSNMESNDFLVQLFDIRIKSLDGEINTTYYDYLEKHQKKAIWKVPFTWLISKINNLMSPPVDVAGSNQEENHSKSFILSRNQVRIVEKMKDLIVCNIDKKTNVISIVVTDQDPLISATIADSVRMKLQQFIIDYRTEKARVDVNHYQELLDNAKIEYDLALAKYSEYSDTHKDIILQAYISERDKLENDMSLKYQTYTAMKAQLEAAKSKLQEKVPAFTVLQGASVPIKPTGPKRMIFVIGMLFLSVIVTSLVVLKGQIADMFKI